MNLQAAQSIWPVLAFLAYMLVTCTLLVLAAQRRHALEIHNRIRESKRLREEYLTTVQNKQQSY